MKIILVIEGGSPLHSDIDSEKSPDTIKLQEGFYRLLGQEVPRNQLDIRMAADWITCRSRFKDLKKENNNNAFLLVDSDAPNESKEAKRIERKLKPKEAVFFMVQEMEAWFLSQPDKVEEHYDTWMARKETRFAEEITESPQDYSKPSKELINIITGYYYKERKGVEVKPKFRKLRDGAALLELLDLDKLQNDFQDVKRLIEVMQTKIAQN